MAHFIRLVMILLSGSWLVLVGCNSLRNEVDPSQLTKDPTRLVVTCFLSPQDLVLAVKVTRTKTVLSAPAEASGSNTISYATVKLSDGKRSVGLRYDAKQGIYRADIKQLPIVAGRTYSLFVKTPTGQPVTSTCTIPDAVKLVGASFDSLTEGRSGREFRRYFVRVRWQDPAGKHNFYQVTGLFRSVDNCSSCGTKPADQTEEVSFVDFDSGEGSTLKDETMQGRMITSEPGFVSSRYVDNKPGLSFKNEYKSALVVVNLLNIDQSYYNYQNGIRQQAQVAGNPFAEPLPIPSNIQGGLGCFGAYNRSTVMLKLN